MRKGRQHEEALQNKMGRPPKACDCPGSDGGIDRDDLYAGIGIPGPCGKLWEEWRCP